MKFSIHRIKKDCSIPASALAVAGLKREKELRLEVESGVIVALRPEMNAKKLLSVSEFLRSLAADMVEAVVMECGDCVCCGDCPNGEDCECDYCDSRDDCRGICVPDCLLEQAGIGKEQKWKVDTEDGSVTIRVMPDDDDDGISIDDIFTDEIPESVRSAILENDMCIPHLRELLCSNDPIPF